MRVTAAASGKLRWARDVAFAVAAVLAAGRAAAQQQPASFEFTFSSPGARAMGFGGAFVPLADDATAAFANPAGLVQLVRPELSAELRVDVDEREETTGDVLPEMKGLGFFSFVWPSRRWSFAVYGHRLGAIEIAPTEAAPEARALQSGFEALGLEINRFGAAAGYRLDETFSIGVGASYFAAAVDTQGGAAQLSEESSFGLNAGVLWRPAERVSVGGFYRQGPEFEVVLGAAGAAGPARSLAFPDSYGVGAAARTAGGALTLSFEWARVDYASLNRLLTAEERTTATILDATDELHVGAEYAFLTASPIVAIRFGGWLEPGHRLLLTGSPGAGREADDDEIHAATGLGFAWRRFQLDFGADVSETVLSLSVSGIVSF